jgi:hypothetical protein
MGQQSRETAICWLIDEAQIKTIPRMILGTLSFDGNAAGKPGWAVLQRSDGPAKIHRSDFFLRGGRGCFERIGADMRTSAQSILTETKGKAPLEARVPALKSNYFFSIFWRCYVRIMLDSLPVFPYFCIKKDTL